MEREEALELVREHVDTENLIKHMLAVEACMRALARKLERDEDRWALAGLLHDVDYELTADDESSHGERGARILRQEGLEADIVHAVRAHNAVLGVDRTSELDRALYCVDPLTGLIVAAALVHPERSLDAVDTEFVLNRFGEKAFARGADREQIKSCCELDLELEEFVGTCLKAMQDISDELGL